MQRLSAIARTCVRARGPKSTTLRVRSRALVSHRTDGVAIAATGLAIARACARGIAAAQPGGELADPGPVTLASAEGEGIGLSPSRARARERERDPRLSLRPASRPQVFASLRRGGHRPPLSRARARERERDPRLSLRGKPSSRSSLRSRARAPGVRLGLVCPRDSPRQERRCSSPEVLLPRR
jgi:hypothetical protein